MNEIEKDFYTFELLIADCRELAEKLKGKDFDCIVTMALGGMIPACIIGELLGLKKVHTVTSSHYDGTTQKESVKFTDLRIDSMPGNSSVLVIDDIVETGATMESIIEVLKLRGNGVTSVALHYKCLRKGSFAPDFFVHKTSKWVVYPWEFE